MIVKPRRARILEAMTLRDIAAAAYDRADETGNDALRQAAWRTWLRAMATLAELRRNTP